MGVMGESEIRKQVRERAREEVDRWKTEGERGERETTSRYEGDKLTAVIYSRQWH